MENLLALLALSGEHDRDVYASALREGGFDVQVGSPAELPAVALRRRPEVVLLDLDFPGAAAWRTVAELQGSTDTCDIPVIALSSTDMLIEASRLFEAGFCGYLQKPVGGAALLAAVRYCLSRTADGRRWVDLRSG